MALFWLPLFVESLLILFYLLVTIQNVAMATSLFYNSDGDSLEFVNRTCADPNDYACLEKSSEFVFRLVDANDQESTGTPVLLANSEILFVSFEDTQNDVETAFTPPEKNKAPLSFSLINTSFLDFVSNANAPLIKVQ
jgi:hypothetical protein